jgi:hypothetical protein
MSRGRTRTTGRRNRASGPVAARIRPGEIRDSGGNGQSALDFAALNPGYASQAMQIPLLALLPTPASQLSLISSPTTEH